MYRDRADEQLPVYVVLQTPYQEEDGLKAYIERLSISIEAYALNGLVGEGRDGGPRNVVREVLWSGKIATKEDPVIIVEETEDGEDEDQRDMFIIWKISAFLSSFCRASSVDSETNACQLDPGSGFRLLVYYSNCLVPLSLP